MQSGQLKLSQSQRQYSDRQIENSSMQLKYEAPWIVFSIGLSQLNNTNYLSAIGSFCESNLNEIQIIQYNDEKGQLEYITNAKHNYPPSKLRWLKSQNNKELLISAGKNITIWDYDMNEQCLNHFKELNNLMSEYNGPQNQFDFHDEQQNKLISTSIDSTYTVWDIDKAKIIQQVKAHNKEINDISFGQNINVFATVSEDGSCRQFDLRQPPTEAAIIYRANNHNPLLEVSCEKVDGLFISFTELRDNTIYLYDIRYPKEPLKYLKAHIDLVTQIAWSPHQRRIMCSTSDDCKAYLWDLQQGDFACRQFFSYSYELKYKIKKEKTKYYTPEFSINDFQWSSLPSIIGMSYQTFLEILKID